MSKVAYAAREAGEELTGGTVAVGDGKTLDVAALLEEGNGTITVDADSPEDQALGAYPALKRTTVNDGASESAGKSGKGRKES